MTDDKLPSRKNDDSVGETPSKPGKKVPSEWGVGRENSRSPADAEQSPTSKT
jgi:hypothetical protein